MREKTIFGLFAAAVVIGVALAAMMVRHQAGLQERCCRRYDGYRTGWICPEDFTDAGMVRR